MEKFEGWIGLHIDSQPYFETVDDNHGSAERLEVFSERSDAEDRFRKVAKVTVEYEEVGHDGSWSKR